MDPTVIRGFDHFIRLEQQQIETSMMRVTGSLWMYTAYQIRPR